MSAEIAPLYNLDDLSVALAARAAKKTLVFCNTRHEVEQVAASLRDLLPFEATVLAHYADLDSAMRRAVEVRFAEASVAVCVSTSTLELGVDIGSVDEVALLGPPLSLSAFLQRVGRGARRRESRVLCLARSVLELRAFDALLHMGHGFTPELPPKRYRFRPSVLVQQVFSLVKQSPTGGLRLADLRRSLPEDADFSDEVLRRLLGHLVPERYLTPGRPGEWRAGAPLHGLADEHEIYGNIGGEPLEVSVVDAYSGHRLARTDRLRPVGGALLMAGRPVEVARRDRRTFAVKDGRRGAVTEAMRLLGAKQAVPLELARGVALTLGIGAGEMPLVEDAKVNADIDAEVRLFNFWGDLYGPWLAETLRLTPDEPFAFPHDALSLRLPRPLPVLPPWDGARALEAFAALMPTLGPLLELGRFHPLLPPEVARRAVLEGCDVERFEQLYRAATPKVAAPGLAVRLREL